MKKKKIFFAYAGMVLTLIVAVGVSLAAFTDKGEILGSTFTIGSADIKFLLTPNGPLDESNSIDELQGPEFIGIGQTWQGDYLMTIWNNGTQKIGLTSRADYETINDPAELRYDIIASVYEWVDNGDGEFDESEIGTFYETKSILKWKTEGMVLGEMEPGQVRHLLVRFNTDNISNTLQGATAMFDFEFNSIELPL